MVNRQTPLGKIPSSFYLSPSVQIKDIANQNLPVRGLFTSRLIRKGRLIGEYRGPTIDEERANTKRRFTQYFFAVYDFDRDRVKFIIDGGNSRKSSFLRYVNAPNHPAEANCQFVQHNDQILLYSTRKIEPKTELLAWYGSETHAILRQR